MQIIISHACILQERKQNEESSFINRTARREMEKEVLRAKGKRLPDGTQISRLKGTKNGSNDIDLWGLQ